jgi:hypothetical protein
MGVGCYTGLPVLLNPSSYQLCQENSHKPESKHRGSQVTSLLKANETMVHLTVRIHYCSYGIKVRDGVRTVPEA